MRLISLFSFYLLLAGCSSIRPAEAMAVDPVYHPNTTRKMFQVTGDFDRPLRRATASLTESRSGMAATDLGSCFEHKGVLYFLFGDCWGVRTRDVDTWATTSATRAEDLVVDVAKAADGKFLVVDVPGIAQGGMCVISGGISVNGNIYIVHTTQWYGAAGNMERSVLARSSDDGYTWTRLYDLSRAVNHDMTNARFINVSMAEVDAADYGGALPWGSGKVTLIYGSGAYRKSNVCLAAIPSAQIEDKAAMRYFAGMDPQNQPTWSALESEAAYLFTQPEVGEFSVAWIPQVGRWVMLYNASNPRGITMRTSVQPWGPWSSGKVIMEPWADGFYGVMAHIPWGTATERRDGFHDGGRQDEWGGEYGPYIIPRFTRGDANSCQIYYTLSTWNPYQFVLMRSEIGAPIALEPAANITGQTMPGDSNWRLTSQDFFTSFTRNGVPHISTFAGQGDAAMGCMWRYLPRDTRNRRLQFSVHGGGAEVMVLSGGGDIPTTGVDMATLYQRIKKGEFGEVVHCTWGHDSNDITVKLDWDLRPFDRANLKVVVIDHLTAPWGFVSVSRMTLVRAQEPSGVDEEGWRGYE